MGDLSLLSISSPLTLEFQPPFTVHHIIIHSLQYEHMFDVQSLLFCAELNVKVRTVGLKCNIVSDGWGENKIVFRLTISQTETT